MATRSLFDELAHSVGNAVNDVREKLIEEAWFGRTTAPQERMSQAVGDLLVQAPSVSPSAPDGPLTFDRLLREFVPQRDESQAPYFDRESRQFSDAANPRSKPMSWDEMTAQLDEARGYKAEREIDRDIER